MSKCDGGWRAGVVGALGSMPPKPCLPGARRPALLARHWEQEGELAAGVSASAPAGGAVGEGSG